jgi:hypothetical protein
MQQALSDIGRLGAARACANRTVHMGRQPASAEGTAAYPTLEECASQPRHHYEMSGEALLLLSAHGDKGARRERFVREVMLIDGLSWPEAAKRVDQFEADVSRSHISQTVSKIIGTGSVAIGVGSLPMVFHLDTALWFNERFVTTDVPEARDLETWLEVGQWTWNWMEPPIGTISFVFIALQFARGRGVVNPLEAYYQRRRERQLLESYPKYSPIIILQWAESLTPGQDYTSGSE